METEKKTEKLVLFVCTGNHYRSRFAEAVFNHEATLRKIPWRAISRGLATHKVHSAYSLSPLTQRGLNQRGIPHYYAGTRRIQLADADLESASCVIALSDSEHRPMVEKFFPHALHAFEFWEIGDSPLVEPDKAMMEIDVRVHELIERLVDPGAPKV